MAQMVHHHRGEHVECVHVCHHLSPLDQLANSLAELGAQEVFRRELLAFKKNSVSRLKSLLWLCLSMSLDMPLALSF